MKTITGIISVLLLTSCNHYFYVPTVQAPLFTEKNEYRAAASYGSSGDDSSPIEVQNIQLAYSITKNLAVMTDFMKAKGGEDTGEDSHGGKGSYFDGALGYYKSFDKQLVLEVYGGVGHSKQQHYYEGSNTNLSFRKIFIQPAMGLTFEYFDIAFTPLFSNVYYYNIHNSMVSGNFVYDLINELSRQKSYFFFEPGITIRGGWKYIKIQTQYIGTFNLTSSDLKFPGQVNIGFIFSFPDKYKIK